MAMTSRERLAAVLNHQPVDRVCVDFGATAVTGVAASTLTKLRQAVLAEAIQRGVVVTSKIANPKTPAYPTTTIRLNRAEAGMPDEAQRFHPVAAHGESIAEAIEEERGNL